MRPVHSGRAGSTVEQKVARPLDFIIIGAQKSGTTSLFHHLRSHPGITMPPQKELMFFTPERNLRRGWDAYAARYYRRPAPDTLWGKATPQYMMDPAVPGRIRETMPDVRLIAILRNPIDRAVSHHAMNAMRGNETAPFHEAILPLLDPAARDRARCLPADIPSERHCYLVWGEYGRVLSNYRRVWPENPPLVLFLEEFRDAPLREMRRIYAFLGLDSAFIPPDLTRRYLPRRPGDPGRVARLGSRLVHRGLKLLPRDRRSAILFRHDLVALPFRPVPRSNGAEMAAARDRLRQYFRGDVRTLRGLLGRDPPWPDFARGTPSDSFPPGRAERGFESGSGEPAYQG